ncbi:MAG: nucleotidyl transferase AbiEii/AbiGii toxin family protein [Sphingomonas sp.]
MFNGLTDSPRLLFKGGTSLSKGFGLINRFSEDIDVTVFRDDLGLPASVQELAALSRNKRDQALDAIKTACETYINGPLLQALGAIAAATGARNGFEAGALRVEPDAADLQTLLMIYPSVTPVDAYIAKSVKIESGAKSALDPNTSRAITPYVNDDLPALDLTVPNVVIVDAERTFWDKIVILHGLRRWYGIRGELRGDGQRISRHYYDLYQLLQSETGSAAVANRALGEDCVAHARIFFDRPDYDLKSAHPPTFALCPEGDMTGALRQDYRAMSAMIFGDPPPFDAIIEEIAALEKTLNIAL